MEFSGERYLPSEVGQIRHEHMHRYAWCREVVKGKVVLDIACGEGYGSAMLARGAAKVIGVDIAEEAVEHATKTYAYQRNLEFKQGDAAAIPLPNDSVDIVVSFETIEHHDRHYEMLSEVRRVLHPDGLMIMSSPNREVYSELAGYHNDFHVKELDFDEFDRLLRGQFDQVEYFGQRLAVGSSIFSLVDSSIDEVITPFTDTGEEIVQRPASLTDPIYFLAVAGNISPVVERKLHASVLFSEAEDLYVHHREVVTWAKSLDKALGELRERYAKSVADGQSVSEWAQSLAQEKLTQANAAREATEAWQAEQKVRIGAEQMAQDQAKAAREATEAWQREQKNRIAAEQMAQDQSKAAREATEAWQAEQKVRIAAEQMAQDQSKAAREATEAWQAEQKVRLAAEQMAQDQSKAAREATEAWQAEQKVRIAAEQMAQDQSKAAREATEAWQAEQKVRIAAEQMAQDQSKAAREATEAWQAEQKVRLAAEQMAQDQSKAAREATEAWQAEQKVRIAVEQMAQDQSKAAREATEAWQAEQKVRIAAEQMAQDQSKAAREATEAWQMEQTLRMEMEQLTQEQTEAVRETVAGWRAEQQARMAAEQSAKDHAEAARRATSAWQDEQKARLNAEKAARDQLVAAAGEIVKRDARIHTLEQEREELRLIKASRSWRWTRPLRFLLRTVRPLKQSAQSEIAPCLPSEDDHARSATGPQPALRLDHSSLAQLTLAGQEGWRRDFFVWAVIDWHFRIQRPQHLARELATAGHRVFYISNNFVDSPEPGFVVEPLDDEGRLFQINLHLLGSPAIYHAAPNDTQQAQLRTSTGLLLEWTRSRACASLVQHPYWLETAEALPNHRMVYDCMDHHGGFADNTDAVLERERDLMRDADLLVVTSEWLYEEAAKESSQRLMIRNACQYEHFAMLSEPVFKDSKRRKIIGYYGAIAEWFDLELLEKVARRFSDCLVLLVGADTCGARERLKALNNVQLTGEVPYAALPHYLGGFDVCLLPFQVIPLTLATNPVKIYEYLSAGKEVVSIDLPEIRQFGNLVHTGHNHATFLDAVDVALKASPVPEMIAQRREFAAGQTWAHRVKDLIHGVENVPQPRVSVVVVTYNNLEFTQACLDSLHLYSDYANLEIIVVDNASVDETPAYLQQWAASGTQRHIVLNDDNRGFAAANNQGLTIATGEYLVMLNNDTYVTPGWVATLVGHLRRNEKLGMLGPVTNNIGNEARIEINYASMEEMLQTAGEYTAKHAGQLTPLRTAAFFCVMLRRSVFEKVGPLDEVFGIGFFEDDDYCRRVEKAGWSIACADDVFIHHNLSASFNKLKQEARQALFETNKAVYEAKWGEWVPHSYRTNF